jgi:hypothetical protein
MFIPIHIHCMIDYDIVWLSMFARTRSAQTRDGAESSHELCTFCCFSCGWQHAFAHVGQGMNIHDVFYPSGTKNLAKMHAFSSLDTPGSYRLMISSSYQSTGTCHQS